MKGIILNQTFDFSVQEGGYRNGKRVRRMEVGRWITY